MNKDKKPKIVKCLRCLNYDKDNDCCKLDKNKKECSKSNFSKCQNFQWHYKYTMF